MSEQFDHGYALVIGVDANAVARWALPDVARDASALHAVLVHPQRCAYPGGNVRLLRGNEATRQGILDGLAWLHACIRVDANATAILYYSGHGWRDDSAGAPDYCTNPYDASEIGLRSRALRATDWPMLWLSSGQSACWWSWTVAMPEAWASRALRRLAMPIAVPPSLFVRGLRRSPGRERPSWRSWLWDVAGLCSLFPAGEQRSYMRRDGQMSLFTYHLIEALTGHAQPQEGASEVLVSDVISYVWRHVPQSARADWNAEQTPDYQVSGNFAIALLLGGKGLSKGQPSAQSLDLPPEGAPVPGGVVIDTRGGPIVGRDFDNRGTYITSDQVIQGDQVWGDRVGGDKIPRRQHPCTRRGGQHRHSHRPCRSCRGE